ncbi:putative hydroxymethylpyrimidine transporter CytX [Loigolactobacillus zhaoyuanensis]|uniref:putative hydroxymethylpyrimidine transporter CytX n=1 Tax=Loigolactobacillus zhaoyuanensis TaxID=2486017 RepID=UPI000F73DC07|nr:putative hydroxymethylpyrimidine transporter CytX [Loigolactobacillus zhaoyuanensis]
MGFTSRSQFLLWLGAAISIAEIMTGTLLAPLGLGKGVLAILVGHVIGCFLFLLPAAYIGAAQKQTAIQSTQATFGAQGVWAFSLLNALQLLGWTAVMIVNAAQAMNGVTKRLFGVQNVVIMSVIVALLIVIWLLFDYQWLLRINNLVVGLLFCGTLLILVIILRTPSVAPHLAVGTLSFGAAVELNVTMALSWLPVIGDYTQTKQRPLISALTSSLGYFMGSSFMFILGLLVVTRTGMTDVTKLLATSGLGLVALLIIIFSTVTTTFMDAYSAATSVNNLTHNRRINFMAIIVTVLGLLIALGISMSRYENFLYFIGSVFTPLYAIVFTTYFVTKRSLPKLWNLLLWLFGVWSYYQLQKINLPLGTTVGLLLLLGLLVIVSHKIYQWRVQD